MSFWELYAPYVLGVGALALLLVLIMTIYRDKSEASSVYIATVDTLAVIGTVCWFGGFLITFSPLNVAG